MPRFLGAGDTIDSVRPPEGSPSIASYRCERHWPEGGKRFADFTTCRHWIQGRRWPHKKYSVILQQCIVVWGSTLWWDMLL